MFNSILAFIFYSTTNLIRCHKNKFDFSFCLNCKIRLMNWMKITNSICLTHMAHSNYNKWTHFNTIFFLFLICNIISLFFSAKNVRSKYICTSFTLQLFKRFMLRWVPSKYQFIQIKNELYEWLNKWNDVTKCDAFEIWFLPLSVNAGVCYE